jgi:hypothetical protein
MGLRRRYHYTIQNDYARVCMRCHTMLPLHQTASTGYVNHVFRCIVQGFEANIVATRLMIVRRIGAVAYQAYWQTTPRHGVLSLAGW